MLYAIVYQRVNEQFATEILFKTERDMENYYNIWLFDEECDFCMFFYDNREYTPLWID